MKITIFSKRAWKTTDPKNGETFEGLAYDGYVAGTKDIFSFTSGTREHPANEDWPVYPDAVKFDPARFCDVPIASSVWDGKRKNKEVFES